MAMKNPVRFVLMSAAIIGGLGVALAQNTAPAPAAPPAQQGSSDISVSITGDAGAPLHYAVPDFIARTNDKETVDAARVLAEVLWNDLAFEREFDMIPRDTYKTIEQTPTTDTIAFDRWREIGADAVVKGAVRRTGNTLQVEMRLFSVRGRGVALGRVYDNVPLRNPRSAAHTISDDIHQSQSGLKGVARTSGWPV